MRNPLQKLNHSIHRKFLHRTQPEQIPTEPYAQIRLKKLEFCVKLPSVLSGSIAISSIVYDSNLKTVSKITIVISRMSIDHVPCNLEATFIHRIKH